MARATPPPRSSCSTDERSSSAESATGIGEGRSGHARPSHRQRSARSAAVRRAVRPVAVTAHAEARGAAGARDRRRDRSPRDRPRAGGPTGMVGAIRVEADRVRDRAHAARPAERDELPRSHRITTTRAPGAASPRVGAEAVGSAEASVRSAIAARICSDVRNRTPSRIAAPTADARCDQRCGEELEASRGKLIH